MVDTVEVDLRGARPRVRRRTVPRPVAVFGIAAAATFAAILATDAAAAAAAYRKDVHQSAVEDGERAARRERIDSLVADFSNRAADQVRHRGLMSSSPQCE